MTPVRIAAKIIGLAALLCATDFAANAQTSGDPTITPHEYSTYEKLVFDNVSKFHVAFNAHDFEKNGELVADDIHVSSNRVELVGRQAFVNRIARFLGPFPDIHIQDLSTIVDGNRATVRYVLTGTQDGDLETPDGVLHATHRKINVDGAEFFTFDRNAKLVELVTIENLGQLSEQLKPPH